MPSGEPKWVSLLGASATQTGLSYLEQGVPALVPYVKAELGLSSSAAGIFAVSVNAGRAVASTPAGWAVARYGNRRNLFIGCVASGAAGVAAALATPTPVTVALLAAAGLFQTGAIVAGITGIGGWFPSASRGRALGLRQAAVSAGGLLAAATLPLIAISHGWRPSLAVAGLITVAVGSAGAWLYRELPAERISGVVGAGVRSKPALRVAASDPAVRRTIIVAMSLSASQYIVLAYIQVHFIEELRVGLGAAAVVLAVIQGAAVAGRLGWGALSDVAFGGRRTGLIAVMLLLGGVSAVGIAAVPPELALSAGLAFAVVLGLVTVGSPGIYIALLADVAPTGAEATTIGAALSFVLGSAVVAPPIFGLVADLASYDVAWIVLAGTLVAQIPVVLSIGRVVAERAASSGGF